jgi:hypothetical protein
LRQRLRPRRAVLAAFVVALLVYAAALAIAQPSPVGDEPHYALEAISLARDGDRDLANQYGDVGLLRSVYGSDQLTPQGFVYPGRHEVVSVHNVGLPLLLVPAALVSTDPGVMRLEMVVIAALAAALLMALLERVPLGTARQRWLAWAAVVLSAPMVVYGSGLFGETPAAVLILAAVLWLTPPRRVPGEPPWAGPGPAALAGASTAAALLPWLNFRYAPFAAVIVLVALWSALRRPAAGSERDGGAVGAQRAVGVVAILAPLVLSGVLLAWGFHHWYGSISPNAQYAFSDSTRTLSGAYRYLFGGLLSPRFGWLPQAPVALLAVAGMGLAVVRLGRAALIGALAAALYLVAVALSGVGFPGISFAGRLQVVVMPLAAVPLLVLLAALPRARWPFAALLALTLVLSAYVTFKPTPSAAWGEPGTFLARTGYSTLWPDFTVPETTHSWVGQADVLRRDVGRITTTPPLPTGIGVAAVAPAGTAGTLALGRTPVFPRGGYVAAVVLRADTATPATVATIAVTDDHGKTLNTWTAAGSSIPPDNGYRSLIVSFAIDHPSPVTVRLHTTGAAGLRTGGMQVLSSAGSSQSAGDGYPGLGKTIVWTVLLVGAGIGLTMAGRRRRADPPPG